jgi:hypothetical protein
MAPTTTYKEPEGWGVRRYGEFLTKKWPRCHCFGGMFAASGTIIMSNEPPADFVRACRVSL